MENQPVQLSTSQNRTKCWIQTYLLGRDHDTDLFDRFGEFFGLNHTVVVQIEVLESLHEDLFLTLTTGRFLRQLF
jgi:hypothetical protein